MRYGFACRFCIVVLLFFLSLVLELHQRSIGYSFSVPQLFDVSLHIIYPSAIASSVNMVNNVVSISVVGNLHHEHLIVVCMIGGSVLSSYSLVCWLRCRSWL